MTYKGLYTLPSDNTIAMGKQTVAQIDAQIEELKAKRKSFRQDEALTNLRTVVQSGTTEEILLECYRFTSAFRSRKHKTEVSVV